MDPSETEPNTTQGSNRLFVVGAVILLAINVLILSARTKATVGGTAYLIGYLLGVAVVIAGVGLLVYAVARALGKAKTGAGRARLAFWTMAVLLLANLGSLLAQGRSPTQAAADTTVTDSERRGLQLDTDSIRHAAFGFVLPHPGSGFNASPELQRQLDEGLSQQPDMVAWALRDTVRRQALVIQVTKMARVDETGFRKFAAGVREGVSKAKVLEDTLRWQGATGEHRLTLQHPAGLYITMRCLPRVRPAGSFIVCVQTTTDQPNALESSRAGLRFIQ